MRLCTTVSLWLALIMNVNVIIRERKTGNKLWLCFILLPQLASIHFLPPFSELWLSLEEHQYALELIMSKYRRQMLQLIANKKPVPTEPVVEAHEGYSSEVESYIDRICSMGDVMRKAIQVDEEQAYSVHETLAQLELENKELRAILSVSKESSQSGKNESEWNSLEKSQ
ncbi:hypothetical protein GDO81_006452 [Engystomops pustulosus]|uniref:Suppressor of IKBKE 1 n=1 Tax=Engystomops pustulosus TaxID=76066 RepID=A0AAV7CWS9_ENGPU|nr:hypothetical protein GDO81_006452 [Engystomops pustulosus]